MLLSSVSLVLLFGAPSAGQPQGRPPLVPPPAAVSRYQVTVSRSTNNDVVYVCDTHTGQVWFRNNHPQAPKEWTDLGSPTMKEKK